MILSLLFACHVHVEADLMRSTAVKLSADLQDFVVIDRAANPESLAIAGALRDELEGGTRLVFVDDGQTPSSSRDSSLTSVDVRTLCRENDVDGLVTIESANLTTQDETKVQEKEVEEEGIKQTVVEHTLTRSLHAHAKFILTSCSGTQLDVEELSFSDSLSVSERSMEELQGALDPGKEAEVRSDLLARLGGFYANDLIVAATVGLFYFRGGHPDMLKGHEAYQNGKIRTAVKSWTSAYENSPHPRVRGRAAFNIAVFWLGLGRFQDAAGYLDQARDLLGGHQTGA